MESDLRAQENSLQPNIHTIADIGSKQDRKLQFLQRNVEFKLIDTLIDNFLIIDTGVFLYRSVFDYIFVLTFFHGLRTPNEAFFHQNSKLLGLGRQFGHTHFGAFGVFSTYLSAPI